MPHSVKCYDGFGAPRTGRAQLLHYRVVHGLPLFWQLRLPRRRRLQRLAILVAGRARNQAFNQTGQAVERLAKPAQNAAAGARSALRAAPEPACSMALAKSFPNCRVLFTGRSWRLLAVFLPRRLGLARRRLPQLVHLAVDLPDLDPNLIAGEDLFEALPAKTA